MKKNENSRAKALKFVSEALPEHANRLEALLWPTIALDVKKAKDDAIECGASKIGGCPDLPDKTEWPTGPNGNLLAFVAQIRLEDVKALDAGRDLPESGLLSFFYDTVEQPWGFDPAHRGSRAVLLSETKGLKRRERPETLAKEAFSSRASVLIPKPIFSLPPRESAIIAELGLSEEDGDKYHDLTCDLADHMGWEYGGNQLLGHPNQIQGDMQLECQLASNGISVGQTEEPTASRREQVRSLRPGAKDWRLLLQIDSEEGHSWDFGDTGMLYFWITSQGLSRREFEKVWAVVQCC